MRAHLGRALVAFGVATAGLVVCALSFPFIALPAPTGDLRVGTTATVVGHGIAVQLWYPTRSSGPGRRASYRPDTTVRSLRERAIFPFVRTTALVDAPVAPGPHAVVLYLPGWGGRRSDNTALCEDLASRGFVVAAMDDLAPLPEMDFSTKARFEATRRWADQKVRSMSASARQMLNALAALGPSQAAAAVTRTMDFGHVAVVGYSFGGATAAQMAVDDPRVRAAVNLDGWTFGEAARRGVNKPFMIVGTGAPTVDGAPSDVSIADPENVYEAQLDRENGRQILDGFARYGGYNIAIDGTQHEDFCDEAVLPFLRRDAMAGSIESGRAHRIIAAYVGDFIEHVLLGRDTPLLAQPAGHGMQTRRSEFDRAALVTTWNVPLTARSAN